MELKDFTEKEQKEVREGLSTAEISDKEAADKILALVPEEWIKKIPFFVRKHATPQRRSRELQISILIFMLWPENPGSCRKRRGRSFAVSLRIFFKRR